MEELVTLIIFGIIFGLISLFNYFIKQFAEKTESGEEQADHRTARSSSSSYSAPQEEIKQFLQQIKGQAQTNKSEATQSSPYPKSQSQQYHKTDVGAERLKRERERQQRLAQEQKRQQRQELEKQKTTKTAAQKKPQKQRRKKAPAVSAYSTSPQLSSSKSVFDSIGGAGKNELQKAVVMSEILGKPIGLRDL